MELVCAHVDPSTQHINPDVAPLTEKRNVFASTSHDAEDEKIGPTYAGQMEEVEFDPLKPEQEPTIDPFVPFDDLPEERQRVITIRAMLVGCVCGALVNASNLYLGLKTGWTFGANLFGAIVGFSVIKAVSRLAPANVPILGGSFGPRENNIVQTAATASGGLSNVFISAIPALYQLNLLTTPKEDFWRLVSLTVVGGYFGFLFATPCRCFHVSASSVNQMLTGGLQCASSSSFTWHAS